MECLGAMRDYGKTLHTFVCAERKELMGIRWIEVEKKDCEKMLFHKEKVLFENYFTSA